MDAKYSMNEKLLNTDLPDCLDLYCIKHNDEIDEYKLNVMEAIEHSAVTCLPLTGGT